MSALLEISGLVKNYQALRPLRIRELVVAEETIMSLGGFDATAAETFVHLVTGATLPVESEGDTITVGGGQAQVVVPDIQTANATVHLIDHVMVPPAG